MAKGGEVKESNWKRKNKVRKSAIKKRKYSYETKAKMGSDLWEKKRQMRRGKSEA